jgi:hypothetical protein
MGSSLFWDVTWSSMVVCNSSDLKIFVTASTSHLLSYANGGKWASVPPKGIITSFSAVNYMLGRSRSFLFA